MAESSEKKWYVLHTYSGYENKVKSNLESLSLIHISEPTRRS